MRADLSHILCLSIAGLMLVGCQSPNASKVAPEIREIASNSLKYGDYYFNEFNENKDTNSLSKGIAILKEESDKVTSIRDRLLPLLSKESAKATKDCASEISTHYLSYIILNGGGLIQLAFPFNQVTQEDIDSSFDKYQKSRASMIEKCEL